MSQIKSGYGQKIKQSQSTDQSTAPREETQKMDGAQKNKTNKTTINSPFLNQMIAKLDSTHRTAP